MDNDNAGLPQEIAVIEQMAKGSILSRDAIEINTAIKSLTIAIGLLRKEAQEHRVIFIEDDPLREARYALVDAKEGIETKDHRFIQQAIIKIKEISPHITQEMLKEKLGDLQNKLERVERLREQAQECLEKAKEQRGYRTQDHRVVRAAPEELGMQKQPQSQIKEDVLYRAHSRSLYPRPPTISKEYEVPDRERYKGPEMER